LGAAPQRLDHAHLLDECQAALGHQFADIGLLRAALTHSSGADHPLASNERLEFLGDAVLGVVVCEQLFHEFPESHEGELTRIKSVVVSRATCAKIAKRLGLQRFLILGKGMGPAASAPASTLANLFESIIGALYLDGGMDEARRFLLPLIEIEIQASVQGRLGTNYKSQLQQLAQRQFGATPTYHLLDEKGPDHQKCFKVAARIAGYPYPAAWGMNKKDAEQRAALNALCHLQGEPIPFPGE
jgi:ribonuclease-3